MKRAFAVPIARHAIQFVVHQDNPVREFDFMAYSMGKPCK